MLLMGFRPSIGTFFYFVLGKSWLRFFIVMAVLVILTYNLINRSKEALHLSFTLPSPYPSPTVILPYPPTNEYLSPFDACAVEAATRLTKSKTNNEAEDFLVKKSNVYLYRWTSNVSPNDFWTKFVSKFKDVKIAYMNLKKAFMDTPIDNMLEYGGWGGHPDWAIWAAAGLSLLWHSGGTLVPTGVLMSTPTTIRKLFLESRGFIVANGNHVLPVALGVHEHHPIMEKIFQHIQSKGYKSYENLHEGADSLYLSPLSSLLKVAVKEACGTDDHTSLGYDSCNGFKIFGNQNVFDLNVDEKNNVTFQLAEDSLDEDNFAFLIRKSSQTDNPKKTFSFFRWHRLQKYCPKVTRRLKIMTNESL